MKNATREYILKKTSPYPQLVQAPLYPGPDSVWEAECWSRTQEPAEGCSSERRSGCRLESSSCHLLPVHWPGCLYTINTDTVPYPLHHTPAAVMLSQPSTLLHIHIHSHCTASCPEFKENFGKLPFAICYNT